MAYNVPKTHRAGVTEEVARAVHKRDLYQLWLRTPTEGIDGLKLFMGMNTISTCAAPFLDPSESGKCSGRNTLDHVNDQPTYGKRAPDDEQHLVTLCEFHHQGVGDKGGRVWATANRPLLRDYLKSCYEGTE